MAKWRLRCTECGTEWILEVSFNLKEFGKLYHYCRTCGKNTFHEVLGIEEP
jgi:ribosomal protein L44E